MTTNNAEALRALAEQEVETWLTRTARKAGPHGVSAEQESMMRLGFQHGYLAALASQPQAAGAGGDTVLAQLRRELAASTDGDYVYTDYEKGRIAEKRRCIDLLAATPAPAVERGKVGHAENCTSRLRFSATEHLPCDCTPPAEAREPSAAREQWKVGDRVQYVGGDKPLGTVAEVLPPSPPTIRVQLDSGMFLFVSPTTLAAPSPDEESRHG